MKNRSYEARALSDSALMELFDALKSASSPEEFLGNADAILASPMNILPLPVSFGMPDMLRVVGNRAVDVSNAPRVHEYLGEMDRANASDARLWTYLAFSTYRDYMEKRWPLEVSTTDSNSWKRRVEDRWLLHSGSVSRGSLIRHGIARLWWVTHLTYETEDKTGIAKDDPYAYTREVFKNEDRLNAIFDREVGAFSVVVKAVLKHAAALGSNATDKYIQRVMQYLKLVNGYRDIGALDSNALNDVMEAASDRANNQDKK